VKNREDLEIVLGLMKHLVALLAGFDFTRNGTPIRTGYSRRSPQSSVGGGGSSLRGPRPQSLADTLYENRPPAPVAAPAPDRDSTVNTAMVQEEVDFN
jgi:hypothetical protein